MGISLPFPTPAEWPDINKLIAEREAREARQVAEAVAAWLAGEQPPPEPPLRPTTTDCRSKVD